MKRILYLLVFYIVLFAFPPKALASVLFQDSFQGLNGDLLSTHNPLWVFKNYQPGTFFWGEYQIWSNRASDGSGQIYNSDRLNVTLPSHFRITEKFFLQDAVSSDPNLAFMDIRLSDLAENNEYTFRFYVNQPNAGTILQTYGPISQSVSAGTFYKYSENILNLEYDTGNFQVTINSEAVMNFHDNRIVPDHLVLAQSRYVPTASLSYFSLEDLDTPSPTPTPTPVPIDCVMSDWGGCSVSCGGGTQSRSIITDAQNGGIACGDLTQSCNTQACPTPTPTPEPTFPSVSITRFSQRDPKWKGQTYDSASQWSPASRTIESWGCALTSASTVLDYYGIKSLPNGSPNNPGQLNSWLKSQPDGYLREGAVNWNAISRLSKLMSTSEVPALEYSYKGNLPALLQSHLSDGQPVILNEPGHFVTAYRYHSGVTDIVDPYWTSGSTARTTLSSYGNAFLSMRTFTPSHTDLSYLISVSDSEVGAKLYKTGPGGDVEVSDVVSYTHDPLIDPLTGKPGGQPFQILEFAKPHSGEYKLELNRTVPGFAENEIYLYDPSGNVKKTALSNFFGSQSVTLKIVFDAKTKPEIQKILDFNYLKTEIEFGSNLGYFRQKYLADELEGLVTIAQRVYPWSKKISKSMMQAELQLLHSKRKIINEDFFQAIYSDSKLLMSRMY